MKYRLTKLGIQQFGKSIQVWIQVGEKRYDIEIRIQACSIDGPQIELQGESSLYLSGGFQGLPYQQSYQQPIYPSTAYQSSQPYQPSPPYQPTQQPYQPSQQPYQSSQYMQIHPSQQPSYPPPQSYPSQQALVQTTPSLHWQGRDRGDMNISIRDNHITIPEGTMGSQLFKVVIHNYSDHKVMISLDPVLAPFSCSYHDIVINP